MNFMEFQARIVPACRTKHLFVTDDDVVWRKAWKRVSGRRFGNAGNKIPYRLGKPAIPREFVRLEPWEMEYLFMLASRATRGIVETGRFNGGSILVMACANGTTPAHSIDIAPRDDELLKSLFRQLGIGSNVELIVGDSQKTKYPQIRDIDLLFVDGDHSYAGCTADLDNWYDQVVVGGHIVLHDCYFGCEVQPAVIDFVARRDVEVVTSPYKTANHYRYPEGSLCHLIKRGPR